MWIYGLEGFVSVVEHRDDSNIVIVRARAYDDLYYIRKKFMKKMSKITTTSNADYPYRAFIRKKDFARGMFKMVMAINYPNFKNAVSNYLGSERSSIYHQIWYVNHQMEDDGGKKKPWAGGSVYSGNYSSEGADKDTSTSLMNWVDPDTKFPLESKPNPHASSPYKSEPKAVISSTVDDEPKRSPWLPKKPVTTTITWIDKNGKKHTTTTTNPAPNAQVVEDAEKLTPLVDDSPAEYPWADWDKPNYGKRSKPNGD